MNNKYGILSIFYSQFNIEKGGEIIVQYPTDYLSNEEFLKISEYVLPKKEICNNIISLKLGKAYYMGYPIHLTSQNYDRTKFQFNFSLIVSEESYIKRSFLFENLLIKIGKTFEEYEIQSGYSLLINSNMGITQFVKELYVSIKNNSDLIKIPVNITCNTFNFQYEFLFKMVYFDNLDVDIKDYLVPVFTSKYNEKEFSYASNSVKDIYSLIDGVSHVKKIVFYSKYSSLLVKYILYNFLINNIISLVDIFQYSNIYRHSKELLSFHESTQFLTDFKKFYILNSKYKSEVTSLIDEDTLFSLYVELGQSENVMSFVVNYNTFQIEINVFIAFGVYYSIIERVHLYGVLKEKSFDTGTELFKLLTNLLDGTHNMDEVCCETNKSLKEIFSLIRNVQGINLIYK